MGIDRIDEGMTLSAEDVVAALDCCGHMRACKNCPLNSLGGPEYCMHTLLLNALDLIRLKNETIGLLEKKLESAYTDFAARLKEKAETEYYTDIDPVLGSIEYECKIVDVDDIDDILKELTETGERE